MVGSLFKLFIRLSCHPPIKLSIFREVVDERHEGIAYLHQAVAGFCIGDVAHLLFGYVEKRSKLFPVACGLVVHDYELGVGEHARAEVLSSKYSTF